MNILVPPINNDEKPNKINVKIWETINSILSKIYTFISVSSVQINWLGKFR